MTEQSEKRVLVISNTGLSPDTSNGRTISNLLRSFDSTALAQFYLHGKSDHTVCAYSYCVSDREAMDAFLLRKGKKSDSVPTVVSSGDYKKEKSVSASDKTSAEIFVMQPVSERKQEQALTTKIQPSGEQKKIRRSCKNLVLRDLIWRSGRWCNNDFTRFLDNFQPEVVLLQAGDSPFMYAIARKIARKYHAGLTMFNTENYVLKKVLYAGVKEKSLWHLILRHRLRVQYRRFMKKADFCIYNTDWLEEAYQKAYPHPGKSRTFYVSTELEPTEQPVQDGFHVTYCGNLGVGRVPTLVEFAKVLEKALPEAVLDIYGKFTTVRERQKMESLPNVIFHGTVPYEQVPGILAASAMVLHCENPKRAENLRYAFSTKIADSLACGRPFLVYASREYPFVNYLNSYGCAHIASEPKELFELLTRCKDRAFCDSTLENAKLLAEKNHNSDKNAEQMKRILCNI